MRRQVMRFLPVFVLALAVQIFAPIGACWASVIAASDPLNGAVMCQGASKDHASGSGESHHMREGACAFCAAATALSSPDPDPALTSAERHAYRVAWTAFQPDARAAKAASSAQARGPPSPS